MGEQVRQAVSMMQGRAGQDGAGRGVVDTNTYLEKGVPVNVVNNILDCIFLVHFGSQQLGCHRPVLFCLPVHLSHGNL